MIGNSTSVLLGGGVKVMTTSGRGFNPEEVAERALDKIIAVGSDSHPAVRVQAEAFKNDIRKVLVQYMKVLALHLSQQVENLMELHLVGLPWKI